MFHFNQNDTKFVSGYLKRLPRHVVPRNDNKRWVEIATVHSVRLSMTKKVGRDCHFALCVPRNDKKGGVEIAMSGCRAFLAMTKITKG